MLCVVRFLPSDIEDLNQRVQNFASQVNISNLNIRVENARDVPSDAQDLVSFISKHCFSNMSDSEREQLDEIRSRLPNITEKSIQYCTNLVCSQSVLVEGTPIPVSQRFASFVEKIFRQVKRDLSSPGKAPSDNKAIAASSGSGPNTIVPIPAEVPASAALLAQPAVAGAARPAPKRVPRSNTAKVLRMFSFS